MGAKTKIGWTDSTVNFWHGCTKVGPGCEFCYAEQFSKRVSNVGIWGVGVPRRKIASARGLMIRLNNQAPDWSAEYEVAAGNARAFKLPAPTFGPRRRVFVQSMSDLFDLEVPVEWFDEAWICIQECDRLALQIVTKRVTAIEKRLRAWSWPKHAGLIITVVNQEEADRDVPRALALKAKLGIPWLGLSVEPQIGPILLRRWEWLHGPGEFTPDHPRVDWIISGGESKQGKDHEPRPYDLAWARSLRDQCAASGVAYFQKQLGARPRTNVCFDVRPLSIPIDAIPPDGSPRWLMRLADRQAGADQSEWPADLMVQNFPEALR